MITHYLHNIIIFYKQFQKKKKITYPLCYGAPKAAVARISQQNQTPHLYIGTCGTYLYRGKRLRSETIAATSLTNVMPNAYIIAGYCDTAGRILVKDNNDYNIIIIVYCGAAIVHHESRAVPTERRE